MTERLTLSPHPSFPGVKGPVLVVVMDGVGIGKKDDGDAVFLARTPNLDWLAANTPSTALRAHGTAVGLPSDDDMGNSEVGHNTIGAGRVFDQGAKLVNRAIDSGSIWQSEAWRKAIARVKESGEPLHFIGLLSDGNVHSHIAHLIAMLRRACEDGVEKVRVHALLDGRDVPATSALEYVDQLEQVLEELRKKNCDYRIASGGGRMAITMDRYEADWPMVERGWKTHVLGEGRGFPAMREAIETLRKEKSGIGDQNLPAFVIEEGGRAIGPIRDGAAVVLFNFRGDRAIEITRAFEEEKFEGFERKKPDVFFAGMMQYDGDLGLPASFLVEPPAIDRSLGQYLAAVRIPQLAISETQKYGHVTYFWNGNRVEPFEASTETYIEIRSDTLPFEERPWMKAAEITDRLIAELEKGPYRHARVNYANGDMVGHTGVRDAAILAVEAVDLALGRLIPIIRDLRGAMIVTADHGNADEMFEIDKKTGKPVAVEGRFKPKTSHTLNPVPCHIYAPGEKLAIDRGIENPGLANIAATVLHLMGFASPPDYSPSLLS